MKRSILKKMIVLTLAFAMVFSSVITAVSANTAELSATFTATADKASYVAGDTVVVTVAANGDAADAIGLDFTYDEALTLVSAEWAVEAAIADVDGNRAALAFNAPVALAGDLFVITLTVNAEVADGTYNVTVTPVAKNGAVVLATEAAVAEVVVGNAHECVFGDWQKDETSHWKECECGEVVGLEDHAYANACDALCDTCGYTREVGDHALGAYEKNDEGHWQVCGECGTATDAVAHEYTWEVTVEPGKTTTGTKVGTCVCGHTITKTIPALLRFQNAGLTLSSNIQFNFNVPRACFDSYGYTDAYAIFEFTDKNGKLQSVRVDEYRKTTSYYVFDFAKFAPDMMGDEVYATLYAKNVNDGEDYVSATVSYSVVKYATSQLTKTAVINDVKFRTLLVDMLNYGATVQNFTGYKKDTLVNAGLTETQKSWATTDYAAPINEQAQSAAIDNALLTWKSAALVLNDAVTMTVDFYANDLTDLDIKVTCGTNEWIFNVAEEYAAEEGNVSFVGYEAGKGNRYTLKINTLGVANMRKPVYVIAEKDGTIVSRQITYSIQTYAYTYSIKNTSNVPLKNLVIAMIKYGDAVAAYAGK